PGETTPPPSATTVLKWRLKMHAISHTERPFACELCGKSFRQTFIFLIGVDDHVGINDP
uniref:C2H2-type domain-containing protein n=1 Tax=Oryzias latipes TaxID=8090 RepID=A0A3P9M0Q2_ORYLA